MPDKPDFVHKTLKELSERIEDNNKLAKDATDNASPFGLEESIVAINHSHNLLKEARDALKQNDRDEAAHQLRREVDFCHKVPRITNGVYEKTAKAGLKALAEQKSTLQIIRTMENTWENNYVLDTAAFSEHF